MSANLDFLRSYAVLVVLSAHSLQAFNNNRAELGPIDHHHFGRWGVLVFFVHTSLVLMQSLARTPVSGGALAAHFYTRRIFRLYPLSMLAVAVGIAFQIPAMPHLSYEPMSAGHVVSNLALTTNLTDSPLVQVPLWSLPLEAQMYLLLPLLFVMTRWQGARWWVLVLWLVAVQSSRALRPVMGPALSLLPYVPCFLGGIAAYVWGHHLPRLFYAWTWPLYVLAIWLVYAFLPRDGWIPCLLLGLGIPLFRELSWRPLTRAAAEIAKYSYGIYLAHMPLIWVAFVYLGDLPLWQQWVVFVTGLVATSVGLYHLLEAPMIRVGSRLADRFWGRRQGSTAVVHANASHLARL